jgi:hypothetical protein
LFAAEQAASRETENNGIGGDQDEEADADSAIGEDQDEAGDADEAAHSVPSKRVLPPRLREPSKRMRDAYALAMEASKTPDEPETLEAALLQPDGELWRQAADEEMQSLKQMNVYTVVDDPGEALLDPKWVLKRKRNKDGLIERYKARLVVKGYKQRKGIDYDEVFASVARHATLRALLAVAAVQDLEVQQIDVKTAFLNGPLDESLYMKQPPGYNFGTGKVLKLQRALYGLKQAARAWNQELVKTLEAQDFEVSCADASLFVTHHFVRERVARGEVKVEYCPSQDMLADMMTKALPKPQHVDHYKRIGLVNVGCD